MQTLATKICVSAEPKASLNLAGVDSGRTRPRDGWYLVMAWMCMRSYAALPRLATSITTVVTSGSQSPTANDASRQLQLKLSETPRYLVRTTTVNVVSDLQLVSCTFTPRHQSYSLLSYLQHRRRAVWIKCCTPQSAPCCTSCSVLQASSVGVLRATSDSRLICVISQ